jgi:hypothetical protein
MLHDYLRDTLEPRYNECKSCGNRTQFTCIQCDFCYSCHWKKEELEKRKKIQFEPLAVANSSPFSNYPQAITDHIVLLEQSSQQSKQQHQHQLTKVIDVFGQETEPICTYHACHHKFSLHDRSTRLCKCHHARNYAIGIQIT